MGNGLCITQNHLSTWIRTRSLFIIYVDDYIHGDLNINRFIFLVLLFVISIIILIESELFTNMIAFL
ncbi:hypothetical protein L9F63_003983, partial [Diploptera punctata]